MPENDILEICKKEIAELETAGQYCLAAKTMFVRCGDGSAIELLEIKPENKKSMLVKDFINGYKGGAGGHFQLIKN